MTERPAVIFGCWGHHRVWDGDAIRFDFLTHRVYRGPLSAHLSPMEFKIAAVMARAGFASLDAIVELLWGDCADGGSIDPRGNIAVRIAALRRKFRPLGLAILTRHGVGYEMVARALPSPSSSPLVPALQSANLVSRKPEIGTGVVANAQFVVVPQRFA